MPRRKRPRFSFLDRALKAAGGSPAAGSRLGNYKDFKEGRRTIEVTNRLTPAERKKYAIALIPFNKIAPATPTAADRYRTTITQYSDTGRRSLTTLTNVELGFSDPDTLNESDGGYYPAILRLFVPSSATDPVVSNPISQITGERYSRTEGKSFTIPFGRKAADVNQTEEVRRKALAEAAKTGNGSNIKATGVSYEAEYFANTPDDVPALPA